MAGWEETELVSGRVTAFGMRVGLQYRSHECEAQVVAVEGEPSNMQNHVLRTTLYVSVFLTAVNSQEFKLSDALQSYMCTSVTACQKGKWRHGRYWVRFLFYCVS